ncbi:hypothetical protein AZE42_07927 [Rhizopogon vesiculosus]|uniref:Uncharacterized protein n=1 Tax=Rhizopogon vesiculosus TaxID=180088 RepID=A0A1J8QEP0_9AGAM|nr:hypothetical protein AZE42_07927 [Rhizopogon vesiculosus]
MALIFSQLAIPGLAMTRLFVILS